MVKNGIILLLNKVSALLGGETSKHDENVYYLTCFHSYATKNKLEKHYKVCKNRDYCYAEMPNEYNKILKHKDEKYP